MSFTAVITRATEPVEDGNEMDTSEPDCLNSVANGYSANGSSSGHLYDDVSEDADMG